MQNSFLFHKSESENRQCPFLYLSIPPTLIMSQDQQNKPGR